MSRAATSVALPAPNGRMSLTPRCGHAWALAGAAARAASGSATDVAPRAVYPFRRFPESGGLVSYGPDLVDQFRRAAGYADRILKGTRPAELPVQAPVKFELVVNLKTAKTLGLEAADASCARR